MIKAIIFDFFGVVRTDSYESWLKMQGLKREGEYFEVARLQDIGAISNEEFYKRLSDLHGAEVTRAHLNATTKIHYDTVELIGRLKKNYRIAVLSNSPLGLLRTILKENDLEKYFDEVVISSEVGFVKPSKEIFALTLDKLDCHPSEVIFIDDNTTNVEAAEKFGIRSLQFTDAATLENDLKKFDLIKA